MRAPNDIPLAELIGDWFRYGFSLFAWREGELWLNLCAEIVLRTVLPLLVLAIATVGIRMLFRSNGGIFRRILVYTGQGLAGVVAIGVVGYVLGYIWWLILAGGGIYLVQRFRA